MIIMYEFVINRYFRDLIHNTGNLLHRKLVNSDKVVGISEMLNDIL